MQLTVRSYLMAGMAAAGAGALAIAPLPSLTPDVSVPTVEAPVALAVAPTFEQLLTTAVTDSTSGLAAGAFGSGASANTFLGYDTQVLGAGFVALPAAIAANPQTNLPLAAISVAGLPLTVAGLAEPQFTGVQAAGNQLPGQADTTSIIGSTTPPGYQIVPTVVTPINKATTKAAESFDNLSAAVGGPKLAKPFTTSAQEVGTSIVQAQGLVRNAVTVTAAQASAAIVTQNPQGVATALQNAPGNLQKAVLGDPSGAAGTVKKLGAIGTVSATVQKAADRIGNAVSGSGG